MQTFKQPNDFEPEGGGTVLVVYVVAIVFVLAIVCGTSLFQSYMEMRTFNKFSTTTKATLWDAMFADLRVIAQ